MMQEDELLSLFVSVTLFCPNRLQKLVKPAFFFFFNIFWLHPTACGISVPQPGLKPVPLHWQLRVLTTGLPGKSQLSLFIQFHQIST